MHSMGARPVLEPPGSEWKSLGSTSFLRGEFLGPAASTCLPKSLGQGQEAGSPSGSQGPGSGGKTGCPLT